MDDLKVSVIVPVYKVEQYLDRCVGSIVGQTYNNLEIILVDDGSPDQCPIMCDAWGQKDSRIKVVHKKNGGLGDARNAGLNVATGDLIGFVDSDDWCEPSMYERLVDAYREYRASIVVCDVWVDWENGWPSETKCMGGTSAVWNREETAEAFFGDGFPAWMWNKVFERSLWKDVRFRAQLYEDIPVMRTFVNVINRVAFTHSAEYHYIQRQNSIVNSEIRESHLTLLNEMIENYKCAKLISENAALVARREVVWEAYCLLYKMIELNVLKEKQDDMVGLIKQYWKGSECMRPSGAFNKVIVKKIATGKHFEYLIKAHNVLQKLYFKLKIKELIGNKH